MSTLEVTEQTTLSVGEHVVFRELDGEAVLLDLESGRYFGLDEVGSRIWALLAEGDTIANIRKKLLREYAVEETRLQRDIQELMSELAHHGLVAINQT